MTFPRLCVAFVFLLLCPAAACGGEKPGGAPAAPSAQAAHGSSGWTLVFSDEFDRPGAPDPAKWAYETGYIRNKEAQDHTSRAENVRVEAGNLVIEGRKEPVRGVRIHVSEREHAGALRVPLRPRRGPGETPRRHRRVAGDLDLINLAHRRFVRGGQKGDRRTPLITRSATS